MKYSRKNAPMSDIGRLMDGITVADICFKNRKITKITSKTVNASVKLTS